MRPVFWPFWVLGAMLFVALIPIFMVGYFIEDMIFYCYIEPRETPQEKMARQKAEWKGDWNW